MTFKPCVLQDIPPEETYILESIRKVLEGMQKIDLGKGDDGKPIELSCHMLARAFGKMFGLKVRDGLWGIYDHSWLETGNGNVIDVYPVGTVGGPILIYGPVAHWSYKITRDRYKGVFSKAPFVESLALVRKELARTMARQGI